jgi:hypothetical protein
MAAKAGHRHILVSLIFVATGAGRVDMQPFELKVGRVVIKLHLQPIIRVMAVGTDVTKKSLMHVVIEMAIHAFVRRVAMFGGRRMAANAIRITVFAHQFEVGQQMVEARFNQFSDVSATALVVGVARGTGFTNYITGFAVIANRTVNVFADVFMAVATQIILAGTIKRNVAGRAFGLEFGMTANHFTGHDQRLNGLSSSSATCEANKHCNKFWKSESPQVHKIGD